MPELIDRASERPTLAATLTGMWRYRGLVRNLVLKELKLKYRGSILGFLWSLVNPLAMITVYTVAFTFIIRTSVEGFVFFVLLGLLPWTFFLGSANMATGAIIDSGSLMKSVAFPRAILPISVVLFNLVQFLLTLFVFLPVMLVAYRVPLSPPMLLFPVFLVLQVAFTIGVALVLAAGTTFFRDIRHLLDIGLAILFWLTPILYPLTQVPQGLRTLILVTPLSPFITGYHQTLFDQRWPDPLVLVLAALYGTAMLYLGARLFLAVEDRLMEHL